MQSIPQAILDAFNCAGAPKRLHGGQGSSFLVGDVVLKPVRPEDGERYEWAGEILCRLSGDGFRVAVPLKAASGRFAHAGWGATRYEPGQDVRGRWAEKLAVCRAFHQALHALMAPPMPVASNRWAQALQIAWQERDLPQPVHPDIRQMIVRVFDRYEPIKRSTQIIHSDLCSNILFADGLAPLVIDFSPAHGAPEFAEAILVADAIAWEEAPAELLNALPNAFDYRQMLLRAVNFRVIATALFAPAQPDVVRLEFDNFAPVLQRLDTLT
jgi:uncharacterized protein (TIGR02569 family)